MGKGICRCRFRGSISRFRPHKSGKSQFNTVIDQMSELIKDKKGKVGYSFVILSKKDKDGKI